MATNAATIQALIDSKVVEIQLLQARIAVLIPLVKPSYSIDGQSVSFGPVLDGLFNDQQKAIDSLKSLYELQNIASPWQLQSTGW